MIFSVSELKSNPNIKDFYYILIRRQEPEIDNNKPYTQKVMGSKSSIEWFRENIIMQMKEQHTK